MIRTASTFENLLDASPTQMLDRPGATPHCGTRMQLFFLARLSRAKGSCGVYEISTKSFPAPITFRIISKPRRPGKAPHTMSESSSNLAKTDPWNTFVLTVRIFFPFNRARFSAFASTTTTSENVFDRARSRAISDPTRPDPMTTALNLDTYSEDAAFLLLTSETWAASRRRASVCCRRLFGGLGWQAFHSQEVLLLPCLGSPCQPRPLFRRAWA